MLTHRQSPRVRMRIRCDLQIVPVGWHFGGFTRNLSTGGTEFEAIESLVRPERRVSPGMRALITFPLLRHGLIEECKFSCRICYVNANSTGVEFTDACLTREQKDALELMMTTRSNRWDSLK